MKGIVDRIRPDYIIAIDALAARKLERVNTTIQIADTGIAPVLASATRGWSFQRIRWVYLSWP